MEKARGSAYAGAILRVSIAANRELYWNLKKEGLMVNAFEELFHEELIVARGCLPSREYPLDMSACF